MSYTWITPKTDWKSSDYITPTDYNRIRNNLLYLNDMLNERYPTYAQTLDLGSEKTMGDRNYPSMWNAFENALESFTRVGQNENIGSTMLFTDNAPFINADELNRIELSCQRWYDLPVDDTVVQLPFEFGTKGMVTTTYDGQYHEPTQSQLLYFLVPDPNDSNKMRHYGVGNWFEYFEMPSFPNTYGGGMTSINEYSVCVMGSNENNKAYVYNHNSSSWDRVADVPTTNSDGAYSCVSFLYFENDNQYIYTLGGSTGEKNTLRRYDVANDSWEKISQYNPFSSSIDTHVVNTPNGQYFSTGNWLYRNVNANWNWQKVAKLPAGFGGAIVYHNNFIYCIGGAGSGGSYSKEYFKLVDDTWVKVGDLPYECQGAQAVSFKGKIRVFGGVVTKKGGNSGATVMSLNG